MFKDQFALKKYTSVHANGPSGPVKCGYKSLKFNTQKNEVN